MDSNELALELRTRNSELSPEVKGQIDELESLSLQPIKTTEQFDAAGRAILEVAASEKNVIDFFEPLRVATYNAYQAVLDKKKPFIDRLTKIRQNLNKGRSDYKLKLEAEEREQQRKAREEAEQIARELQEKLLVKAAQAEEKGNATKAETLFEQAAEVRPATFITPSMALPKTSGVADLETWTAVVENASLVPIELNGFLIRPIDTAMLNKIAKTSKGQTQIPGVKMVKSYGTQARGIR
jgi:hypothetical protein